MRRIAVTKWSEDSHLLNSVLLIRFRLGTFFFPSTCGYHFQARRKACSDRPSPFNFFHNSSQQIFRNFFHQFPRQPQLFSPLFTFFNVAQRLVAFSFPTILNSSQPVFSSHLRSSHLFHLCPSPSQFLNFFLSDAMFK